MAFFPGATIKWGRIRGRIKYLEASIYKQNGSSKTEIDKNRKSPNQVPRSAISYAGAYKKLRDISFDPVLK